MTLIQRQTKAQVIRLLKLKRQEYETETKNDEAQLYTSMYAHTNRLILSKVLRILTT